MGYDFRVVRLKSDSFFYSLIMKFVVGVMYRILNGRSCWVRGREGEDIVSWLGLVLCVSNVMVRVFGSREEVKDLLVR